MISQRPKGPPTHMIALLLALPMLARTCLTFSGRALPKGQDPASANPPVQRERPTITLPIKFIQFEDDDGTANIYQDLDHPLSAGEVARIVDDMNSKVFDKIGIHFTFDATKPVQVVRNSRLFRCLDPDVRLDLTNKAVKPPQLDENATYLPYALSGPPGLLVVARRGIMWRWDDRKNRWIAIADASRGHSEFIAVNATWTWAHEIGHLLGLPHAFAATGLKNVQDIQAKIEDYKNHHIGRDPLEAIDGDLSVGVRDTPPDPGENFWRKGYYQDWIDLTLRGDQVSKVFITKVNMMSYGGGPYVSQDQIELMRATAKFWEMSGGSFPQNEVPKDCWAYRPTPESIIVPKGIRVKEGHQRDSYGAPTFFEASLTEGTWMGFRFRPPQGRYQAWFMGTRGLDHALCELSLGGQPPKKIDLWSSGGLIGSRSKSRLPSGLIPLGEVVVSNKPIELHVKVVGKHRMSFGTSVGIEGVILKKVG